MNLYLPRVLILCLLASATTAVAQSDLSFLFTSRPKNWFSAAINVRSGGGSVHFANIGSLPRPTFQSVDPNTGQALYTYDDGTVSVDAIRADELLSTSVYNADKTRYQTYGPDPTGVTTGNVLTGDYLAYNSAVTRSWSVDNASQIQDGNVLFHISRADAEGASADAPGNGSTGVELQFAHDFGMIGKRVSWGFLLSWGVNDINAHVSKTVGAAFVTDTFTYSLNGQTVPVNTDTAGTTSYYTAPTFDQITNSAGDLINSTGIETTVPLAQKPTSDVTQSIPQGAQIEGTWKLKGSYYLMKLGPSFRYFVNRKFSVSADAGVAGAYVGSEFDVSEQMISPVLASQLTYQDYNRQRRFNTGVYIEANAEYWVTYRTGFFAGAVYEHFGKYQHTFDDATATVDIGSSPSFRLGLITRF